MMPGAEGLPDGPTVEIEMGPAEVEEILPEEEAPAPAPGGTLDPSHANVAVWNLPANWCAEFILMPKGVSIEELARAVRALPDVRDVAISESGKTVSFVACDNEPAVITFGQQFRGTPGTVVQVKAAQSPAPAVEPLGPTPLTPPPPQTKLPPVVVPEPIADPPAPLSPTAEAVIEEIISEPPTPLAEAETTADADPNGTIALARIMLARENLPGWKSDLRADVKEWQEAVGLKGDEKFGPESLARMAEEVGLLPLVRYYPGTVYTAAQAAKLAREKVEGVIARLQEFRPMSDPHIAALRASQEREKGQSMGTSNPSPVDTRSWVARVTETIGSRAEAEAEKEIT